MGVDVAELIRDMADKVAMRCTQEVQLQDEAAKQVGEIVSNLIIEEWGGQNIYVPLNIAYKREKRDAMILEEFTGDNVSELARKYNLSVQAVYRIIKKERERCMQ